MDLRVQAPLSPRRGLNGSVWLEFIPWFISDSLIELKKRCILIIIFSFYFIFWPHSMWDLSSLARE